LRSASTATWTRAIGSYTQCLWKYGGSSEPPRGFYSRMNFRTRASIAAHSAGSSFTVPANWLV
jgi:hypothetical protein